MESGSFKQLQATHQCEAFLITHPATVVWATGFTSSNAWLYLDAKGRAIVTDHRYGEAAGQLAGIEALVARGESLASALKSRATGAQRIGFQPDHLNITEYHQLQAALPDSQLVPLTDLFREEIATKYQTEVALLERAQHVTDAVFSELLEIIKPGLTEKQLGAEIVCRQLQHGADGIAPEFWPLVASGPNTALPHARPTDRKLQSGDVVLMDFGCTVGGYCSDMTRTICLGPPPPKFREVYATVLQAQQAVLEAIRPGLMTDEVDKIARDIIEQAGYSMPYALGHGIGLGIHEWPIMNPRHHDPLPARAVVAIEPGAHLPGEFGVRIEDMVQLTAEGCRNLTSSPKELIIL